MGQGLSYGVVKLLARFATNTFFRDIQVIGLENIPDNAPLIIYGNHNNQFIDALLIISWVRRQVKFIAAAKSMRRPIVGHLGKMIGGIPVERPQDLAKPGTGLIERCEGSLVYGRLTLFTKECQVGDLLLIDQEEYQVMRVVSDTELQLNSKDLSYRNQKYFVLPKVDQSNLFSSVWQELRDQQCIGIFPEGGSHDRTDLLPLKAGICIMALGAISKYQVPIYLLPCGLNYFKGYQFRSKVLIQFGVPFLIRQEVLQEYQQNKRLAIQILLKEIEKHLRDVTIQTNSYSDLCTVILARRVYLSERQKPSPQEELLITRQFAKFLNNNSENEQARDLTRDIKQYRSKLKELGLEDYQVLQFGKHSKLSHTLDIFKSAIKALLSAFLALPAMIPNIPIGLYLRQYSESERRKALKNSRVKVLGKDVVASYKMLACTVVWPISILIFTVLFYSLVKLKHVRHPIKLTLLFFVLWPVYTSLMIRSTDGLWRNSKNLKAKILFLLFTKRYDQLKQFRFDLQRRLRKYVEENDIFPSQQHKKMTQSDSFETSFSYVFESLEDIGI